MKRAKSAIRGSVREPHGGLVPLGDHDRVEERAEQARPCRLEGFPQSRLGLVVLDPGELQDQGSVLQVAGRDAVDDPVQDHRAFDAENGLVGIRIQLAGAESGAGRDPAEGVGEPLRG